MNKVVLDGKLRNFYAEGKKLPGPRPDGTSPVADLIKAALQAPSGRRRLQMFFQQFPELYKWLPEPHDQQHVYRMMEVLGDPRHGSFSTEYLIELSQSYVEAILRNASDPSVESRLYIVLRYPTQQPSS